MKTRTYWRDLVEREWQHKSVIWLHGVRRGRHPVAIECKWSANGFDARNLRAFRYQYPEGENWLVAQDVDQPYERTVDDMRVEFMGIGDLAERLGRAG